MKTASRFFSVLAAFLLLASGAHASSISGDTFSYNFQSYGDSTNLCGCIYDAGGTFTAPGSFTDSLARLSVSGNQLTIRFDINNYFAASTTGFNGLVLTDTTESLTGASVLLDAATTITGYSSVLPGISGNVVSFNFQGRNIVNGGKVVYDILPAAVTPEPSSLMLLGTGIMAVAGMARRRFTA